jgi:hypothetical protein
MTAPAVGLPKRKIYNRRNWKNGFISKLNIIFLLLVTKQENTLFGNPRVPAVSISNKASIR